ncbi:MAG: PAS domain-containing sensor histidine kinase [Rhodospirillaceae bacterium]
MILGRRFETSLFWHLILRWANRVGLAKKLAVGLSVAATIAGFATYAALTESTPFVHSTPRTVTLLLTLDLTLLLLLSALIARRIVQIGIGRRRGLAGSKLHVKLVAGFSVLAITPAILMAIFSAVFFYVGVQEWFSDRVRTAVHESLEVAQAYLHEHQQNIKADALAMANDLNQEAPRLMESLGRFAHVVSTQAALRSLTEVLVFDGTTGQVLARSGFTFALEFEPVPQASLEKARAGDVVLMINEADDRVRALIRLDRFVDTYLYVGRVVESRVLAHTAAAQDAVKQYTDLENSRSKLQITFTLIFVVVALLLLLAAVWMGLNFATRLITPISALIGAAERVRAGDLSVRVIEPTDDDELGTLSRAFNRMTSQIESQQAELVEANQQLDLRRRFTEAVLAGVSAGVIGLDQDGVVTLLNQPAIGLLGVTDPDGLVGCPLTQATPEMTGLMDTIIRRPGRLVEAQVQLRRPGLPLRTLLVRIAAEIADGETRGYVVTFDDITELLSAQRKAAWADVARRIAHEIKNPLTPIQLAAERLKRKYLKEITSDKETFQICVETIVRQVGDIGRMVDEFSAFARMPSPVMKPSNINDICRQAVFLQSSAHPGIHFDCQLPPKKRLIPCDSRQISQALTNLLQNAVEAIDGRALDSLVIDGLTINGQAAGDSPTLPAGDITIRLSGNGDRVGIIVEDNGKGLPADVEPDRLMEPYVTTRVKGTGLGLAIVRKIMEDHGGDLLLENRAEGGARVSMIIPCIQEIQLTPDDSQAQTIPQQQKQMAHGA